MRLLFSIILFTGFLYGCTSPLNIEKDYEKISLLGYEKDEIIDVTYCQVIFPTYISQSTCMLTDKELIIYRSRKFSEPVDKNKIEIHKFSDLRKIAKKDKLKLSQIQVLAKSKYFAIELTPNTQFVNREMVSKWYDYILEKDVASFEASSYMTGPVTQYQVIYR